MVAQNVILPFLLSMMLGRTIDVRNYNIRGTNVFDDDQYTETKATAQLMTKYSVFQDDSFPYTYFGIPPDIAFRIKSNFMISTSGALGLDGLLKDTSWKANSAIMAFTTLYRTVERSLKADAVPLDDWTDMVPKDQTHYVKTLYYGGWAQVLFRFKCDVASDIPFVRKVLTKHLGVVGVLSNDTDSKFEQAVQDINNTLSIRGKVTLSTYVYSTVPFRGTISTPKDIHQIIEKLSRRVGGVGIPLIMNLNPLHDLDPNYPKVGDHNELFGDIEKMNDMIDDLKLTRTGMMKWILETNTPFKGEQEARVNKLLENVHSSLRGLSKVASVISLFKEGNKDQVESVLKQYHDGLEKGISTYNMAFRRLKEEIDAQCEPKFLHKIRGLLRVYDNEVDDMGRTQEIGYCKLACIADDRCRAIGYATEMAELDLDTGLYHKKYHQCWLYYRSTSTAPVNTPSGISGDLAVYDRVCY